MTELRKMLRAKVHRATVTHANVDYEGSITLSPELLAAAGFAEFESVHVWNVTSGSRFETYTMLGEKGTSDLAVNGAAAHLVSPGDLVIVSAFTFLDTAHAVVHRPRIVFVDAANRVTEIRGEVPGPQQPPK